MTNEVIDGVMGELPELCLALVLGIYSTEFVELQCKC